MPNEMAFDRVVMTTPEGKLREYSVARFLELPVQDRVRSILEKRLKFFRGADPVDQTIALKSLRAI